VQRADRRLRPPCCAAPGAGRWPSWARSWASLQPGRPATPDGPLGRQDHHAAGPRRPSRSGPDPALHPRLPADDHAVALDLGPRGGQRLRGAVRQHRRRSRCSAPPTACSATSPRPSSAGSSSRPGRSCRPARPSREPGPETTTAILHATSTLGLPRSPASRPTPTSDRHRRAVPWRATTICRSTGTRRRPGRWPSRRAPAAASTTSSGRKLPGWSWRGTGPAPTGRRRPAS
jgi:hypothetical protein